MLLKRIGLVIVIVILTVYHFGLKARHSRLICNPTVCEIQTQNVLNMTLSTTKIDLSKIESFTYENAYDYKTASRDILDKKKNVKGSNYNKYYIFAINKNGLKSRFFRTYTSYTEYKAQKTVTALNNALKSQPINIDITY